MARRRTLLLGALFLAVAAQPAAAQEGSGLYEPFPGPVTEERAVAFVRTMVAAAGGDSRAAPVDAERLEAGVALDDTFVAPAPTGASERGEASGELGGSLGLLLSIAVLLALGLALPMRAALRG